MEPVKMTGAKTSCSRCGSTLGALSEGTLCPVCLLAACLEAEEAREGTGLGTSHEAVTDGFAENWGGEAQEPIGRMGDFELLEEIGRGAMGVVYRARQVSLDRVVAVKVLLAGPLASLEAIERFRIEALAAGGLHHPGIVAIHEAGTHEGRHYLVMDYVAGRSLAEVISDLRFEISNPRGSARWVKAIAEAVHHAHEHGVLHRDLKPSNVLIDADDQPRVTDFGLAKRLGTDSHLTMSGEVVGSPGYLPPEQAGGRRGRVNRASDVYSLGAMLYHLLTGRPPFVGEGTAEVIHQVLDEEPVRPRLVNPKVPRDLETICLKCLEKEPGGRYPTARELAEELGRYLNDEPIRARPVSAAGWLWRWCHRNPALAAALGACVMLLLSGVVGVVTQWRRAEAESQRQRRFAYAADMNLAQQALAMNNLGRAQELLDRHRPRRGQLDLRGWEWRYLWQQCQSDAALTLCRRPSPIFSLAVSSDGRWLAVGEYEHGGLSIWDMASGHEVPAPPGGESMVRVAFSPQAALLACSSVAGSKPGVADHVVRLWDVEGQVLVNEWTLNHRCRGLAFSGDGRILMTCSAGDEGRIALWRVPDGELLASWPAPQDDAGNGTAFAITPDLNLAVYRGQGGKSINVLCPRTGELRWRFVTTGDRFVTFALSPDGKRLATSSGNVETFIRLWDAASGREVARLEGHRA